MSEVEGSVETGNPDAGNWADGLDDYQEMIDAKGWKGPGDVLQSYAHLERAVGADKVVLPTGDADLTEWEGWAKLGTPEAADGYELGAPEGFEAYDQGLSDWFREAAHGAKLPAPIAQRLHDQFVERMQTSYGDMMQQQTQQQEEWEGSLRKEFGTAFDDRVSAARTAIREFGTPELQQAIDAAGLGSHPELVKAFANIGMALGKGPQFKDAESSGNFGTTPEMAKEEIAKIRSNPALYDQSHPEYKVLNEKLTRMTELAYGTEVIGGAG